MISRRSVTMMLMLAFGFCADADAQVRSLGKVPMNASAVEPACHGCGECNEGLGGHGGSFHGGHYGGHHGVVWGNQCVDCKPRRKLFPPCPNPCRTTLLGEVVLGVKHAVDAGLSNAFHCVFHCGQCNSCGYDSCQCGDGYVDHYGEEAIGDGQMQPVPAELTTEKGNPFGDDPLPQGAAKARSSMRSIMPSARVDGPAATRRSVRPVSNEELVAKRRAKVRKSYRQSTASKQFRTKTRSTASKRTARPAPSKQTTRPQLRQVGYQQTQSDPALRFRSE
ncbi:MAG: hypothetical protein GY768_15760 [Planctomycetaceae bacterium]|nr:hypothetical protein [Planctomycetaceae bacterium]